MSSTGQFPIFRLATLLARQFSSPIATRIKEYAKHHPRFGRAVCATAGRSLRAAELRFKLWSLRLSAPTRALVLSDRDAIEVGANILGEAIVFGFGSAIIIFEVNRQAEKQEAKILDERSQWVAILVALEELQCELILQQADIDRLQLVLHELTSPTDGPLPSPEKPVPPDSQYIAAIDSSHN